MSSLSGALTDVVARVFSDLGLPPEYGRVTVSNRPDLGQFQCNGALAAAKAAKQNPRAIAEQVMAKLQTLPQLRDISLAGPGFINLSLTDKALAEHANKVADDERLAVPTKKREMVVMDYGGAEHRQDHACRPSAGRHHRRSAAAPVHLRRRRGGRRRAHGRLGPANGHDHLRAGDPPARPALLRSQLQRAVPEREPGHGRRAGRGLSDRRGRLQSRSGAHGKGARGDRRAAAGPARLSRLVAAFLRCLGRGDEARLWRARRAFRSVEGRSLRRPADRPDGRQDEGDGHRARGSGRADRPGRQARRQERDSRR